MIKDVSRQWAAILESDEAADAAYGVACEEACEEADMLEQEEIKNFDEEEISLEECGLADSNNADSIELNEADEEQAEADMAKALKDAKEDTDNIDSNDEIKEYLDSHEDELKKAISKLKDSSAQKNVEKLVKVLKKAVSEETTVDEAKSNKKKSSAPTQFIKAALRFVIWLLKVVPYTLIGTAWFAKKVSQITKYILDKADDGLAEDEKPLDESEIEIASDGVSIKEADMSMVCCGKPLTQWYREFKGEFTPDQLQKMALSGTDLQKLLLNINGQTSLEDSEDDLNEADYREPAARLLDPVGVNASTANLKAQDTAMIGVVETLLKKIDKLEDRLDEACKKDKKSKKKNKEEKEENINEQMMEDAIAEADNSFDDEEDDPNYPEFDEKGLTASQRKDYEDAVKIQELSYERKLTKAEEDKFRTLLDKLPDIAKDYLLNNTMGKAGFARPGNHVLLDNPKMPVDDGGGPENGGKLHFTGDFAEIAPFRYQTNPEDIFQKRSLEKRAQRAAEAAAKKNKKIELPMRGQDVWSKEDWMKMYNSMDKSTQKSWLEDVIKDVRDEYGSSDTESAELQIAMIKRAVGKKVTDDDIKDLIVGLTGKEMTKQGAGKRANLYAKAIRMAFIATMGSSLSPEIREKILQGIKIPGATGLSSIGIPDKMLVKMSEQQFDKFLKNIRIQIDAIQKRKGGSFKSEQPSDEELQAIEAGDPEAGEVAEAMMEDACKEIEKATIDEAEITDMRKFFER